MTNPIQFLSATPRFALPNLFVGQAQKEFTVNEALARLDGLLHPAVAGEADAPPGAPADGECWIVGAAPTGDWQGEGGALACRQAGNWLFVAPQAGMRVFDTALSAYRVYENGWSLPAAVVAPTGGAVEDAAARAAIAGLVAALVEARILPAT